LKQAGVHILLLITSLIFSALASQANQPIALVDVKGTAREFDSVLTHISSPEFEALLARRRNVRRQGYANVLLDELNQDSLSAIISFLKYNLHKAFFLPSTQLVKIIPKPQQQISTPIVLDYPNGFIVIEWMQDRIHRRAVDAFEPNPWEKERK
jgi:hypothetical protein